MYIRDGQPSVVVKAPVGAGGVSKGSLCVISSDTAVKAAAQPTAATVLGIALADYAAGAVGSFELVAGRIITAKYTGSTKTSLTDADLTKVFDLTDDVTVNLDDTTSGCCFCVGYDNDANTIDFIVTEAARIV